jgi:hypothetical protein
MRARRDAPPQMPEFVRDNREVQRLVSIDSRVPYALTGITTEDFARIVPFLTFIQESPNIISGDTVRYINIFKRLNDEQANNLRNMIGNADVSRLISMDYRTIFVLRNITPERFEIILPRLPEVNSRQRLREIIERSELPRP